MSNLGWPAAAPEPTAEHRRLGWVDVAAPVSRETGDDEAAEDAEGQGPRLSEADSSVGERGAGGPGDAVSEGAATEESEPTPEARPEPSSPDVGKADRPTQVSGPTGGGGAEPSGGAGAAATAAAPAPVGPWRAGFGAALRSGTHSESRSPDGRAIGADIYFTSQAVDVAQAAEPSLSAPPPLSSSPADVDGSLAAGEGDTSLDSASGLAAAEFEVTVPGAMEEHDVATRLGWVEADGPVPSGDHPTASTSVGAPSEPSDSSTWAPQGSEPGPQSGLVTPVDNDVDSDLSGRPITHEPAIPAVGENHVDEPSLTAPGTVVSRNAPGVEHGDGMGSLEDEHTVAENVRRRIRLTGRPFPKPTQPRVMTVANQKGGVGKTTTAVNIAAAMAQSGLRILVIDLDPQGNASTALGIDHHAEVPSIYDVVVDGAPLLDVVQPCTTVEGLFCAPATIDLAGAEIELVSLVARETRLQRAIRAAAETGHDYDYVLIDCPPSLGLLTVNAMVAASEVFIPIQCEYYALEGLSQLLKNIELVKAHLNPNLHVSTILLTMYDGRTRLSAQVADEVREHFPAEVLRTTVPRSVRVSEAPSFGETVMTYDPTSSGALAYLEAAGEIADRGAAGNI